MYLFLEAKHSCLHPAKCQQYKDISSQHTEKGLGAEQKSKCCAFFVQQLYLSPAPLYQRTVKHLHVLGYPLAVGCSQPLCFHAFESEKYCHGMA